MLREVITVLAEQYASGQFCSGEELGRRLGVSRTAIWKVLQQLEDFQLPLERVKGQGYRLQQPLELLDAERVLGQIPASVKPLLAGLDIALVLDSTNRAAIEYNRANPLGSGHVIAAEYQTAGRGRRGRAWHSPFGANLYFSVSWRFFTGAASLEGLSLAVGVAVVRALAKLGLERAALKWPNDVLVAGKKLAGILIEFSGDPQGELQVVIGIGVNVAMQAGDCIDQPWTDVTTELACMVSRNHLLAAMLSELMPLLEQYAAEGFAAFRQEWQQLDAFRGCPVQLKMGDRRIDGIAHGVNDQGALLLETELGVASYNGGEVSLRAVDVS